MAKQTLKIPSAPKKEKVLIDHGIARRDDYFWLRDLKDKETLKYIKAENKYTESMTRPLKKLTDKLYKELKAKIKEDDTTAPVANGDWLYYRRFKKGKQYAFECRKPRKGGKEKVLLDGNQLAKGKKYFGLGTFEISPDQSLLAFGVDYKGDEIYTIHFKDLKNNRILKDSVKNCSGSFVWANNSRTYYFTELDQNHKPVKIFRQTLGSKKSAELIFHEQDPKHFLSLSKTLDNEYILIQTHGKITSEIWFGSANIDQAEFVCVNPRREGHEYQVEHRDGLFYILSNEQAPNFKVMVTAVHQHDEKYWQEWIPQDRNSLINNLFVFKNFLVLNEYSKALPKIRVYNFKTQKFSILKFKDPAFSINTLSGNLEYDTNLFRITYSSPVLPPTAYDVDLRTGQRKVIRQTKVKGYKPQNYKCERDWVKGHDGAMIPLTIWYKKGLKRNGKNPSYIYGYGSYGAISHPSFRRDLITLLDRGFVIAIAHIRGGEEMGRAWYEDGKFLKKKNTFQDFISCTEHLVAKKWTSPEKIGALGGSAGGMLMGAISNMRPDLYKVIVAHVPFVDVVNTMQDETLPLTAAEYKEWGNPADKEYFEYMLSYSPYDNVEEKAYPHMYITGGLYDHRVTYWEPTKWTAKLREKNKGDSNILLKIKTTAGHFGASGRFSYLKEEAEAQAFLLKHLGLELK